MTSGRPFWSDIQGSKIISRKRSLVDLFGQDIQRCKIVYQKVTFGGPFQGRPPEVKKLLIRSNL